GNAESRLAMFLLSLSARQQRRQLPAEELCLPMKRADIGNYLGLTVETISRVLHKFQLDGLIAVQNRNITITDLPALRQVNALQT
ncbi:MAG: helix-turn-helix domain-containing protein, partial [Pseudomonadales bacterium]|nr:helix-turn-helix domain-containing protein [Pseudomonadales bacterium]